MIHIERGRSFTNADVSSGTPVAVVSKGAADRLWPGEEALGRTLRIETGTAGRRKHARIDGISHVQVVGIASDVRSRHVAQGIDPVRLYLPPRTADSAELFVRGRGDPEATARHFEETWKRIAAPDESARLFDRAAAVLGYISRAGVHLAGFTAQRHRARADGVGHLRRDLIPREPATQGHRDPDALGASRATVAQWVAGQSGRLIGIGTAVGLVLAMAVSKLMWSRTPMVDPMDPVAYVTGLAIVAVAAVLASIGPALRAMRVDPVVTLKAE